jgi:hypothetical protein
MDPAVGGGVAEVKPAVGCAGEAELGGGLIQWRQAVSGGVGGGPDGG